MKNLQAEMARYGVNTADIGAILGKSESTIRDKLVGKIRFSIEEAICVRDNLFPSMRIEYLFAGEDQDREIFYSKL